MPAAGDRLEANHGRQLVDRLGFKLDAGTGDLPGCQVGVAEQHRRMADQGRDGNIGDHVPQVAVAEGGHLLLQDREELLDLPGHRLYLRRRRGPYAEAVVVGEGAAPVGQGALQQFTPYLLEESRVFAVGTQKQRLVHGQLSSLACAQCSLLPLLQVNDK